MNPKPLLGIFILLVAASCTNNKSIPPAPVEKKLEFYYYPKTNMYYDVANQKYLYSLDSAKTWNTINDQSKKFPSTLGDKKIIYSNTDSVWKYNADHRMTYHGRMYHIIKENNDLPSAYKDAREKVHSPKNITKKTTDKRTDSTEPAKKGIRGFFNRLFGKHKKK